MPRLELCGAVIVARLLDYCQKLLEIPIHNTYAWTNSTVALSWVRGNLRHFKPFVSNRVTETTNLIPPGQRQHIPSTTNTANSASRGLYPHEIVNHHQWWDGPSWLLQPPSDWPATPALAHKPEHSNEKTSDEGLGLVALAIITDLPVLERISNYGLLRRDTAWIRRFVHNCWVHVNKEEVTKVNLSSSELVTMERVWIAAVQRMAFQDEIATLQKGNELSKGQLLLLHPFLDEDG